jgi:hypothetical protein
MGTEATATRRRRVPTLLRASRSALPRIYALRLGPPRPPSPPPSAIGSSSPLSVQLLPAFLAAPPILKQFILTVLYHAPRNLLDSDEVEALTGRGAVEPAAPAGDGRRSGGAVEGLEARRPTGGAADGRHSGGREALRDPRPSARERQRRGRPRIVGMKIRERIPNMGNKRTRTAKCRSRGSNC